MLNTGYACYWIFTVLPVAAELRLLLAKKYNWQAFGKHFFANSTVFSFLFL
jgi:hypothetical protein